MPATLAAHTANRWQQFQNEHSSQVMTDRNKEEIIYQVNSFAQGKTEMKDIMEMIEKENDSVKREILLVILNFLQNTHPSECEIEKGILLSEQKETFTGAVLLRKHSFKIACNKLITLPDFELGRTIQYILSVFKVADSRRRELECNGTCNHFWHNLEQIERK
jgi:ribosomal protein L19